MALGGTSMNRTNSIGNTNVDAISSMKTGRLPFIIRRFEQMMMLSVGAGRASRSTSRGCSLVRCRTASRIIAASRSGVVEVDDEPHPAVRDPDPDPAFLVRGVHQVGVVAVVTA